MKVIEAALNRGANNLSEFESKQVLAAYDIPVTVEKTAQSRKQALNIANEIGYPVALKASGPDLMHKTESDLIRLNLWDDSQLEQAYVDIVTEKGLNISEVLIQEMIPGNRELMAGLKRDAQFGPCVVFGLGGILTEILEDVAIRVAPLSNYDALDMMTSIRAKKILEPFRGQPPVDRNALAKILIALGTIGIENEAVSEIDINPIKLVRGKPRAVDALVVLV